MALAIEDAEQILALQHQLLEEVKEGKKQIEAIGARTAETEQKLQRIDEAWTEVEAKGKRPVRAVPTSDEEADALAEAKAIRLRAFKGFLKHGLLRMDVEDRKALLPTRGDEDDVRALQNKALELRQAEEFKAFSIADDTLGGYFVLPEIVRDEIIRTSILYSPVRDLARIQKTNANSVEIRVRKGTVTAQWVGETGTRAETLGQSYGKAVIPTHEMYAYVIFSRQQLDDEFFDLEADLQRDIAEQFGVTEGQGFVAGDSNNKPQGFLASLTTNVQAAAGAAAITYADLVKVFHKLKPAYRNSPNCKWVFNQNTLSAIRQIVDAQQRPILMPYAESGLSGANPNQILGKPYVEATDMPDIATTKRTVAVGDFDKGYRFVDRLPVTTLRLEELLALSGQVGMIMYKRVGGQIVLDEAMAVLQQA
jgi:HK97 family phage major capsid protein